MSTSHSPTHLTVADKATSAGSVTSQNNNYDVIVVGAGLSGMTAAKLIAEKEPNLRVLVLEKNNRVGGRLHPVRLDVGDAKTDLFDVGAQTFTDAHTHLRALLAELGVQEYATRRGAGEKVGHFADTGIVRHTAYNLPSFGYELNRFMDLINTLGRDTSGLLHLDAITLDAYMKQQCLSNTSHSAIEALLRSILGVDGTQISALYFIVFSAATSGLRSLLNCSQKQMQGSTRALLDALTDRIYFFTKTEEIVTSIESEIDEVKVVTKSGETFHSRSVILAMPPHEVLQIRFAPELPESRTQLLRLFVPGHMTKFVAAYNESFWTAMGMCGTTFCGLEGPISMLHDSVSHGGHPALAAQAGGYLSLHYASLAQSKRKRYQIDKLSEWFGSKSHNYTSFTEQIWEHGGGAFAPGAMALGIENLRKPINRLHWAGTETSTRWPSFMDGAVHAGQRAALEVLHELRPQMIDVGDMDDLDIKQLFEFQSIAERRKWRNIKLIATCSTIALIALFMWKKSKS